MKQTRSLSAFSLVEVAIIMVVISVVGGLTLGLAPSNKSMDGEKLTMKNLRAIESAIYMFYNQNGYLPCPAPLNATGASLGIATDCNAAAVSGVNDTGTDPNRTRMGAVPIKSLDLAPRDMLDAWNNRIVYVVPVELATTKARYDANTVTSSDFLIENRNGAYLDYDDATFFLFSPGPNRKGAYNANGAQITPCGTSGDDFENCDLDNRFVMQGYEGIAADFYDDIAIHSNFDKVRTFGNYDLAGAGHTSGKHAIFAEHNWNYDEPLNSTYKQLGFNATRHNSITGLTMNTFGTAPNHWSDFSLPAGKYLIRVSVEICGVNNAAVLIATSSTSTTGAIPTYNTNTDLAKDCDRVHGAIYYDVASSESVWFITSTATANSTDGLGNGSHIYWTVSHREVEFIKLD